MQRAWIGADVMASHQRFREEEASPKEVISDQIDNHYGQKVSHFQGTPLGGTPSSNLAAAGIELITLEKMNVTCKRRMTRRKTWLKQTQSNIFRALERPRTTLAYCYHAFVFALILASLSLSIVVTCKRYANDRLVLDCVYYLEISLVLVFTFEYVLRIWSCSCHGNYKGIWGKMRFIKKPYMVIDIIVIVATTAVISTTKKEESMADYFSVSLLRFLRFLQVLRVLRIDRQQGAFKMVSNVLYDHRQELITCCYMTFILIVSCSFLVYLAEKSDDKSNSNEMEDLSDGIYWGFITLSTIGYGDFAPQNAVAKWITVIFSFVGTAFFALPAGILGSGFAIQVAQNQKQKHINRRRHPAALLIQYAWRNYVAHPYMDSTITWKRHQMRTYAKENRYSVYAGNETATPNSGRKSFAYLRKKFNSGRHSSFLDTEGYSRSRRSSIGATIPSALELRDRCQSEGNLLLVSPHNVEDNQATIVSLPQSVITDFVGVNSDKMHHIYHSNQDVYFKPLTECEKNVVRFIRKVKFGIAIRKFREQLRPYDIKDVLEQYSEGQMEMFAFMKKCQCRVENALGLKENAKLTNNTLHHRLVAVERKVDTLDEKLDVVLQLLRKDAPPCPPYHLPDDNSRPGFQYAYNVENPYGDTNSPAERCFEGGETMGNPSIFINANEKCKEKPRPPGMSVEEVDELSKRLELLRAASEYSSLSGSDVSLNILPDPDLLDNERLEDDRLDAGRLDSERRDNEINETERYENELYEKDRYDSERYDPERRGSRFIVTPGILSSDKVMHYEEMDIGNTNIERPRNPSQPNSKRPSLDKFEYMNRCNQPCNNNNNNNNNAAPNINSPISKSCKHGSLNSINWNIGAPSEGRPAFSKFSSVPVLNDIKSNTCANVNGHAGGRDPSARNHSDTRNLYLNMNHCNGKRLSCGERINRRPSSDSSTNSTPILSRLFTPITKDSGPACEAGPIGNSRQNAVSLNEILYNE